MSAGVRVAAFVALLCGIFAGAALLGGVLDHDGGDGGGDHGNARTSTAAPGHGAAPPAGAAPGADHVDRHAAGGEDPDVDEQPAGVASTQHGLRLVVERKRFAAGRAEPLRFRILDTAGDTVRDFDVEQARRMHVIVVRRDLRRYQHLHPTQSRDGAWTTPLRLPDAGVYRAFADFHTRGRQRTLGIDLFASGGRFEPLELPAPADTAQTEGYEVALHEHDGRTRFSVRRGGRLVTDLQPYLGARGHLVALREGDLAYRHQHPAPESGSEIAFETGAAARGTYRLFLQFRHEGRVHTAAFTRVVDR